MTEKKAKKTIKLRDLEPTKDARGGNRRLLRQERTRDPPHAVAMAFTCLNKGITVRKSHRGSIPAVRSLFIIVRFRRPLLEGSPRSISPSVTVTTAV